MFCGTQGAGEKAKTLSCNDVRKCTSQWCHACHVNPYMWWLCLRVNVQNPQRRYDMFAVRTCSNGFCVTLSSNTLSVSTNYVHLVLLSTEQVSDLAAGAAGVAGPLVALCILSHGHVGDGAQWGQPWHRNVVGFTRRVDRQVGGRAGSWRNENRTVEVTHLVGAVA